jgi:hypothetical protein
MDTDLRDAARQALEALQNCANGEDDVLLTRDALAALRAALEPPEQKPEAFMYVGIKHDGTTHGPHLIWEPEYMDAMSAEKGVRAVPLYTHPPRREWRSLSEEEVNALWASHDKTGEQITRAIEAALKERNA